MWPQLTVFFEQPVDQCHQRRRQTRCQLTEIRVGYAGEPPQGFRRAIRLEGRSPAEKLEKQNPEGKKIRTCIHRLAPDLLGRERTIGADQQTFPGQPAALTAAVRLFGARLLRQAEIGDFGVAARGEQYVLGFEIAVDDSATVGINEAAGNLLSDPQFVFERPFLLEPAAQARPFDQLHHQVGVVAAFHPVEDRHDRRMAE